MIRILLAVLFAGLAAPSVAREAVLYVFGNSLVNYQSDSCDTSVPYWLSRLATTGGHDLKLDGQWGFLRNFAADMPSAAWSIAGVKGAWNPDGGVPFAKAGFTDVIITPANFIQYQRWDAPYDGANPEEMTPLSATLEVIAHLDRGTARRPVFHIYEGWPEMSGGFPPDAAGLVRYHAEALDGYHAWFKGYVAALKAARPGDDIRLIPVSSVLSALLSRPPLDALPADALYVDDAPHGTANLYFLASLVTYAALYGEAPPEGYAPPETLAPAIRENYRDIAGEVADMVAAGVPVTKSAAPPAPAAIPDAPPRKVSSAPAAPREWPAPARATPPLGMGLNGWRTGPPRCRFST